MKLFRSLLFILLNYSLMLVEGTVKTCADCIHKPNTSWCKNPKEMNSTRYTRCYIQGPLDEWIEWCGGEEYVYRGPESTLTVLEDEPLSNPEDNELDNVIQIKPQKVSMKLAVGEPIVLDMSFKYVSDYSLELYYLMDLSKSMEVDRQTILALADTLVVELKKLTPYFRLGFGTFLDKVLLPYVNTHSEWLKNPCSFDKHCRRPYGFQNILSLTNDTNAFIDAVENAKTSTNWDDPEGGLDALMQVMACDDIGWAKKKTRHLIVYVSGSAFKYAGDGKLAGLTKENDMACHLDSEGLYTYSSFQDYPSVSQIDHTTGQENMYVIFAVKKKVIPLYEALSDIVGQSEASLLSEDSSNIIDIIINYYRDISQTLTLETSPQNLQYLNLTFSSKCDDDLDWRPGAQCEDVDVNKEIKFRITFNLTSCPENGEAIFVDISPVGLDDTLAVEITPLCNCPCEKLATPDAKECNESGVLQCGICLCNRGYSGERCECKDEDPTLDSTLSRSCRPINDTTGKDCNGRGVCECNKCSCKENIEGNPEWKYQGEFCEFSNFDCPKHQGLCSNHGICQYSKCTCDQGWSKEDCSCSTAVTNCIHPVNNKTCDGHGDCHCNQCHCHQVEDNQSDVYFGQYCEDCQNCTGLCDYYGDAIRKHILNDVENNLDSASSANVTIHTVDHLNEEEYLKICRIKRENGCSVRYAYDPTVDDVVYVEKEKCPEAAMTAEIFVSLIILGIVILGIVLLLIWKCWVTLKDRREFEKFTLEWKEANFMRVENPIYKDPVTRVMNPLHMKEAESEQRH